jgi:xanthine dehydrogenase molybdopterin-binding subunit B
VTRITDARVFRYARGWHVVGVVDGRGWLTTAVKAVSPDGRTFRTANTTYQLEAALEWHEDLPRTLPNT